MADYQIEITETLQRVIKIKADSADDAVEKARALYKNERIVLDYSDYTDTEFSLFSNH